MLYYTITEAYKNLRNAIMYVPNKLVSTVGRAVGKSNFGDKFKDYTKSVARTSGRMMGVRGGKRKTRKTKKSNRKTRKNRK